MKVEGLRLKAYRDLAGVWTIGYGHTKNVTGGQVITEDHARLFFSDDIEPIEEFLNKHLFLHQHEFDALVSFMFNLGIGTFKKSTMFQFLKNGNFYNASQEFQRWSKARIDGKLTVVQGLLDRRTAEEKIFKNGDYLNV